MLWHSLNFLFTTLFPTTLPPSNPLSHLPSQSRTLTLYRAEPFQLSLVSWSSAADPSLCSDICSVGQQIPRAGFDLTGIYVDPATVAAVTGLLFWMMKQEDAVLFATT